MDGGAGHGTSGSSFIADNMVGTTAMSSCGSKLRHDLGGNRITTSDDGISTTNDGISTTSDEGISTTNEGINMLVSKVATVVNNAMAG